MTNDNHGAEMQTETTATGDVETGQNIDSQVEATKTFTQEELDLVVQKRVAQVNKKYENVDMEEYKALKSLKEQVEEEKLIKSRARSVAPEHISHLLRKNIKLDDNGNVIVTDSEGKQRYTDQADPMTVDNLVEEFLSKNQYFKTAGPSGTGSTGNTQQIDPNILDLSQLDMNNAEHRKIYKKMKVAGKV